MTLTDIALTTQVVTLGSERAFALLVERHQETVRRLLLRLTKGDGMRADDLAQETFINAWEHLHSFHGLSNFRTWLLRITYNKFIDDERNRQSHPAETDIDDKQLKTSSSGDVESNVINHDIDVALATLSDEERTCIILQCIEGQSIREISSITGLNENTIKSHLRRGKATLADFLRRNGY